MNRLVFFAFICIVGVASGQYGNLPTATSVPITVELETSTLTTLFDSAKGFIDIVFVPFNIFKDQILTLIKSNDIGATFASSWQDMLQAQAGFIACLVFGALFIVLVVVVGLIMCCCRCCCEKCGGKMEQSRKRSKSRWRIVFCIGLLICAVLILAPAAIVLLTNNWINTVVVQVPTQTNTVLQNGINYIDIISTQLQYFVTQFGVLTTTVLAKVSDMRNVLGTPIETRIIGLQSPTYNKVTSLGTQTTTLKNTLDSYEASRTSLVTGYNSYSTDIALVITNAAGLSGTPCTSDTACNNARNTITALTAGFDFNTAVDKSSDAAFMATYTTTCSNALSTLASTVQNGVPQRLDAAIDSALISTITTDTTASLNMGQTQLQNTVNSVDIFDNLRKYLVDVQRQLNSYLNSYSNNYDYYRWIAGIVLGSLLIFIPACYLFAVLLGTCCGSVDRNPTKRSNFSNFGGIFAMSGAGLSFIFAWLLMLLVIITFLIGGMGERYVCQAAEAPNYELLQFVDEAAPLDFSFQGTTINSKLHSLMVSCQANSGLLTAFNLTNLVDVNSINSSLQMPLLAQSVPVAVTLTSTETLDSAALQSCFSTIKASPAVSTIASNPLMVLPNFDTEISYLNTQAGALGAGASSFAATISAAATSLQTVQNTINGLQTHLTSINQAITTVSTLGPAISTLATTLETELPATDMAVTTNLPTIISEEVANFLRLLSADASDYLTWFSEQSSTNLGACLPLYNMYDDLLTVICSYFIKTLNGFWFCVGWATFFMIPAAIFAMKLAKFYRRMDKTDPEKSASNTAQVEIIGLGPKVPPPLKAPPGAHYIPRPNNKIAPMDF